MNLYTNIQIPMYIVSTNKIVLTKQQEGATN